MRFFGREILQNLKKSINEFGGFSWKEYGCGITNPEKKEVPDFLIQHNGITKCEVFGERNIAEFEEIYQCVWWIFLEGVGVWDYKSREKKCRIS